MSTCSIPFPHPNTLFECLQLLASLSILHDKNSTTVKDKVINRLKDALGKYCDGGYLNNKFAESNLEGVFSGSKDLLNKFLSEKHAANIYGPYDNLDSEHKECTHCISKIVYSIVTMLPRVYSALYFLYFNTSERGFSVFTGLGGGTWKSMQLNNPSTQLVQWLKDGIGKDHGHWIERGFNDVELNQYDSGSSQCVAEKLLSLLNHSNPASLQKALVPMLFICPMLPSMLGHALCFLYYFCECVETEEAETKILEDLKTKLLQLSNILDVFHKMLSDLNWKELRQACTNVKNTLHTHFNARHNTVPIYAVCQEGNTELYKDVCNPDEFPVHFPQYVQWLCGLGTMPDWKHDPEPSPVSSVPNSLLSSIIGPVTDAWQHVRTSYETVRDFFTGKNSRSVLAKIVMSLKLMKHECKEWESSRLQNASTAGPFRYGFVPAKGVSDWDNIKQTLSPAIEKLIEELESLNDLLHRSNVWFKATAGGVGATAGVGGSAYSYYKYGSTVTPGVSALLDDVVSFGFNVSDLASAGLHCPLQ